MAHVAQVAHVAPLQARTDLSQRLIVKATQGHLRPDDMFFHPLWGAVLRLICRLREGIHSDINDVLNLALQVTAETFLFLQQFPMKLIVHA